MMLQLKSNTVVSLSNIQISQYTKNIDNEEFIAYHKQSNNLCKITQRPTSVMHYEVRFKSTANQD